MKRLITVLIGTMIAVALSAQLTNTFKYPIIAPAITLPAGNIQTQINIIKSGIFNVLDYGAHADGITDDAGHIQSACNAAYNAGGGVVFVPVGHYATSAHIKVMDNVQIIGEGYNSWIDNISTSAFVKCVIITGNIGDITDNNGIYAETSYPLETVLPGDTVITFKNIADISTFVIGDKVALTSYETYAEAPPENTPVYNNLNIVISKSDDQLGLLYPVKDSLSALVGDPQIRRLTTIHGYDNEHLWMAKNAKVSNLRLTQTTGGSNGWYAVFACGINNIYENLWMDNVCTLFGSNGLSNSIVRNITGSFEGACLDFADFQNDNIYENINGKRFSINANLNTIGVSVHSGSDVLLKNLNIDFGWEGNTNFYHTHRAKLQESTIIASEDYGIATGLGYDVVVDNNFFKDVGITGIYVQGDRAKITNNIIQNVAQLSAGYSIRITTAPIEYVVSGNILGTDANRTTNDIIYALTFSKKGLVQGNLPATVNIETVGVIKKTIGTPGDTGMDFTLTSVGNVTAQDILVTEIPLLSRIVGIEIVCTETLVSSGGAVNITVKAGDWPTGSEYINALSCNDLNEVVGIIDPHKPAAVLMIANTTKEIHLGFVPDKNFDTLTAGKWAIYVTYMYYR